MSEDTPWPSDLVEAAARAYHQGSCAGGRLGGWQAVLIAIAPALIAAERERADDLLKALQAARKVIADAPENTWGMDMMGDPTTPTGTQSWPIKDEHLWHIDQAITAAIRNPRPDAEG